MHRLNLGVFIQMRRRIPTAVLLIASSAELLSACSSSSGAIDTYRPATADVAHHQAKRGVAGANVYVPYVGANEAVIYSADGKNVIRTITKGIHFPTSIAVDSIGTTYIGSSMHVHGGAVKVFLPGANSPSGTLPATGRQTIACDASGNVYVSGQKLYGVRVYGDQGQTFLYKISQTRWNFAIAFDSVGNVYVGSLGGVNVYAPGASRPMRSLSINGLARSLAIDSHDELYVLSQSGVVEFAPGKTTPQRTITAGLHQPNALAIDDHDNLYVANCGYCFANSDHGNVTVYARRKTAVLRTIESGIAGPYAIAYNSPYFYVANYQNGTVTLYEHGKPDVTRVIQPPSGGPYASPTALAFGP
jgi:hypothetical protein